VVGKRDRLVLAVDGGNSKTDVALVEEGGRLRAAVRGTTVSHQAVGLEEGMARLTRLAEQVGVSAKSPADIGVFALAGADYPSDVRLLHRGISGLGVAREGVVVNDTMAALRAGSRRPWGVALICGQGVNGVGVAPDGRTVRFDGVGDISGDWGGGGDLGLSAQAAAVRARDGRGPRTSLEWLVPSHFGLASPAALVRALYDERIAQERLSELSPVVFEAAVAGDAVARGIIDHLADELGVMATALIRRLRLGRLDPDVVLGGGVFRAEDPAFHERLRAAVLAVAPAARLVRLDAPPVLGSALLGLEQLRGAVVAEEESESLAASLRTTLLKFASMPDSTETNPEAPRSSH
jgi:N-acetylglucosamine kinase-like BadF-type ATPase